MTLIETELRAALRAEAALHRPDREAMLDRITQTAMRNHLAKHRPAPRIRIAGAAVAVAAVLGGGGFAQWALAGDGEPGPQPSPPAVTVPVSPAPSATPTTPPSASSTSTKAGPSRRRSKPAVPPSATATLWSDGSVVPDGSSQGSSVVTIRTAERLSALEVRIRVARTPELVSRGGSQRVPGASVTSTVIEEPDALVYRFVLSTGDVLEPGTYTFSARYLHAEGGRDAGRDFYSAAVDGALVASGDFA